MKHIPNRLRLPIAILVLAAIGVTAAAVAMRGCSAANAATQFDQERAFGFLRRQCDFGPRPVGSRAHDQLRLWLIQQLKPLADSVVSQDFEHVYAGKTYRLSNIIARFGEDGKPGVLLCAHWDTRPAADQELEPADRKKAILGANDGASGVAVLLELARVFRERALPVPVTIVLFDGEDFGPTSGNMFLGSRYFAGRLAGKQAYRFGILLDMVGDKDLTVYRERNSETGARAVNDKIWAAARKVGSGDTFVDQAKYTIMDDHLPLIDKGIPCADVIDFDYAYWHTLGDTVDKCSPASLKAVGDTVAAVVYAEK